MSGLSTGFMFAHTSVVQTVRWMILSECSSEGTGFGSRPGQMFVIEVVHIVLRTVQRPRVCSAVYSTMHKKNHWSILISYGRTPATTRSLPNVGLLLCQHRRQWTNINPQLVHSSLDWPTYLLAHWITFSLNWPTFLPVWPTYLLAQLITYLQDRILSL